MTAVDALRRIPREPAHKVIPAWHVTRPAHKTLIRSAKALAIAAALDAGWEVTRIIEACSGSVYLDIFEPLTGRRVRVRIADHFNGRSRARIRIDARKPATGLADLIVLLYGRRRRPWWKRLVSAWRGGKRQPPRGAAAAGKRMAGAQFECDAHDTAPMRNNGN